MSHWPSRWISSLLVLFCCAACSRAQEARQETAEAALPLKAVPAFPDLRIRRPVAITNAGDGSNRLFIVTQQGVIHWISNDRSVRETKTFLDIEARVVYKDRENEEGMLGLAFHPQYERNGQFFVYYTTADAPHTSVVSRFRVSTGDPNQADAGYEEELLRLKQPFWNHNGGNIAFGPDGYLYISFGDGGAARDPFGHGQNLGTWFGSILRIDVDRKDPERNYAVPPDNPFVNREGAQSEIWAYGLRNVWGMSFDRETGTFWAADVGQDLWEEINLVVRGGNYGWSLREGRHPFGPDGVGARDDLIDPIWEYHHDIGKSITGGQVYRGKRLPELAGCFLYADYVSGKLWALKYDAAQQRVVANYSLQSYNNAPIMAFGEDEAGEIYFSDTAGNIFWLERE
jgi:quinoprotein glucose dehydrogenase